MFYSDIQMYIKWAILDICRIILQEWCSCIGKACTYITVGLQALLFHRLIKSTLTRPKTAAPCRLASWKPKHAACHIYVWSVPCGEEPLSIFGHIEAHLLPFVICSMYSAGYVLGIHWLTPVLLSSSAQLVISSRAWAHLSLLGGIVSCLGWGSG